jgi:hypothetical protein
LPGISRTFATTTVPFSPALAAMVRSGTWIASIDDIDAVRSSPVPCGPSQRRDRADVRNAAAGDHALGDGGAGGVQRVLDARLLFLEFGFACGADLDLRHAAGELRETLLELLAVVVAVGALDLVADELDAALDGVGRCRRLR